MLFFLQRHGGYAVIKFYKQLHEHTSSAHIAQLQFGNSFVSNEKSIFTSLLSITRLCKLDKKYNDYEITDKTNDNFVDNTNNLHLLSTGSTQSRECTKTQTQPA